jgi:hypothetical protein
MSDLTENRSQPRRHVSRLEESPQIDPFGNRAAAFTSAEVMMCLALTGLICIGILASYVQSVRDAEHSAQSRTVLGLASQQPTEVWAAEPESRWE